MAEVSSQLLDYRGHFFFLHLLLWNIPLSVIRTNNKLLDMTRNHWVLQQETQSHYTLLVREGHGCIEGGAST